MKKRRGSPEAPVVPRQILDNARKAVSTDRAKPGRRCKVCGSECAPNSIEDLCWVCRRLKISAWAEVDQQMSAQE